MRRSITQRLRRLEAAQTQQRPPSPPPLSPEEVWEQLVLSVRAGQIAIGLDGIAADARGSAFYDDLARWWNAWRPMPLLPLRLDEITAARWALHQGWATLAAPRSDGWELEVAHHAMPFEMHGAVVQAAYALGVALPIWQAQGQPRPTTTEALCTLLDTMVAVLAGERSWYVDAA